jgi:hypothetical protein
MIVKVMMTFFDVSRVAKMENDALREILRRQGLSNATIQRRVNAYLKEKRKQDHLHQLLLKASEEILSRLSEIDLEDALAAMKIEGKPQ